MKKIDKEIREIARQTKCPTSRSYEERMDNLLKNLDGTDTNTTRKNTRTFSPFKAGFAACVLCAVVLVAVPAAAKVNSVVTERMEEMSKKEQKVYEEMNDPEHLTKEHETEAIRYSRDLSADEQKRMEDFWKKYEEEGLFPEGEMQIVEQLEEDAEITSPVYEVWNREFFLPERELTDEELLQMVDLMQKQAYAVENTDEAKTIVSAQHDFFDNPNPGENDMSEEEAIAKASAYLEGMYDVDASSMNKTVEFILGDYLEDGGYGDYAVTFEGEDKWSYEVDLKGETGVLTTIWLRKGGVNYSTVNGQPVAVDEKLRNSAYETTKEKLIAMLGSDTKIVRSTCEFSVEEDGNVKCGALYFLFEMDDGYTYQLRYIVDEDIIGNIYTFEHYDLSNDVSREADGFVVVKMEE